jgi:uncharacterized membrane protein
MIIESIMLHILNAIIHCFRTLKYVRHVIRIDNVIKNFNQSIYCAIDNKSFIFVVQLSLFLINDVVFVEH